MPARSETCAKRVGVGSKLFALWLVFASSGGPAFPADNLESPEYWKPAQAELAKLGDGFLVWESHRTGRWSIWTIKLDGTGLKQLSIEEPDKDQMAPKISPDGKRIAYLSFPKTEAKEDGGGATVNGQAVPLHIIGADGSGDKIVAPDARVYSGWDRAITWFTDNELAYISGDGNTYQLNLATSQSTLLIRRPSGDSPSWLPNSKKTYAAWSFGTFSPLDAKQQMVKPFPSMGGCQPYFTQDGEWGFWEAFVGGPFGVAHLRSWEATADRSLVTYIMDKERSLLAGRDYIYFSMFSVDKRLLAFGAKRRGSPGGYGKADWDIFVVQTDPQDLSVIGTPIRYTFDPECDRFPDVWQKLLPLGFQSAKAPYTATFTPPAGGEAAWDYGDGAKGTASTHLYASPGLYTVTSTRGTGVCGQVHVNAAQPPKALRAVLKDQREVVVVFDEAVNARNATVSLKSQAKIERLTPSADGRTLGVLLAQPLRRADSLAVDGVIDLAQQANKMAAVELPIDVRIWPSTQEGLVFMWQGAAKPNLLRDPEKGDRSCRIAAKGRAWTSRSNDMVLDGGLFAVEDLSPVFAKAIQKSKAFTIELCLWPTHYYDDPSSHAILSYGLLSKANRFVLRQKDQDIDVGQPGPEGFLAITYQNGHLVAYQGANMSVNTANGNQYVAQTITSTEKSLDLAAFAAEALLIGNNSQGQGWPSYRGGAGLVVCGLALYDRALTADELSANFAARVAVNAARVPAEQFRFAGRLVALSKVPQPKEIAPYTRALAINEYLCPDPENQNKETQRIRVAYWALFDGEFQPMTQANVNRDYQDALPGLELFSADPQLAGEYSSDTLPIAPDVPLYFWPEPTRNAWTAARNWAVTGPFAAASDTPPADPNLAWKPVELPAGGDLYMDMNPLFPNAKETVACGRLCVKSPTNRTAIVTVESGGGIKAWLNGKQVMSFKNDRAPLRKQKREAVELNAGWNEFVIETTKVGPWWGFVGDILGADDREMMDCERATTIPKAQTSGGK